jgi:hypothetical protein
MSFQLTSVPVELDEIGEIPPMLVELREEQLKLCWKKE